MKRFLTFVVSILLGATVAFSQAGTTGGAGNQGTADNGNKAKKGKHITTNTKTTDRPRRAHKGGKKSEKGVGATSTPPPK